MKPYANQPDGKPIFNNGLSPIGMIVHLYHDKPQAKFKDQNNTIPDIDAQTGLQLHEYKSTIAWEKSRVHELAGMDALAKQTKLEAWPGSADPNAFFVLEPFFRDGDNPAHNTKNRDYLRNCYYLNFKKKCTVSRHPQTGQLLFDGAPGLLGPNGDGDIIMPSDLWPGCRGRVSFTMFGSEYMGKHFISVRMQNLQKYDEGNGSRIGGGGTPDPASQFGSIAGTMGQMPNPNPAALGNPTLNLSQQPNGQWGQPAQQPYQPQGGGLAFNPNQFGGGGLT